MADTMDVDSPDSQPEFVLRAELRGHEGQIRAICVAPNGEIITGAMDATVRRWRLAPAGGVPPEEVGVVLDHDHWVNALLALPAGVLEECPEGGFVTGCLDKRARAYSCPTGAEATRVRLLDGHDGGVISLAWAAGGALITGSWDGTARLWDLARGSCVATLRGHENGVCVLGLPSGDVATGSTGRQEGNAVVGFQLRM